MKLTSQEFTHLIVVLKTAREASLNQKDENSAKVLTRCMLECCLNLHVDEDNCELDDLIEPVHEYCRLFTDKFVKYSEMPNCPDSQKTKDIIRSVRDKFR